MTGMTNKRNYSKFGKLDREQTTFAHLLGSAGYATCIAGKWQLGKEIDSPQHFGFSESLLWQHTRGRTHEKSDTRYPNPRLERNGEKLLFNDGEYSPDIFVDFICEFIKQKRDGPFIAYYPMVLVHCPFCPTPDSADWDPGSFGMKSYKGRPKYFGDMVTYADKSVGRILGALDESGQRKNTIVIFIGDNGTDKPIVTRTINGKVTGAKGTTLDSGCRVPCVIEWPAGMEINGRTVDSIIDFSDFLPTLCEVADVSVPKSLSIDGQSFAHSIRGTSGHSRDSIFEWYSRNGEPEKAVEFSRDQKFKLYGDGRLFDISTDPLEQRPLTKLTRVQRIARVKLQAKLDEFKDIVPPQGKMPGK